ncbi:MAG: hypothetical protein WCD18_19435 [Thermosynechococcaceae cyanobacterium]
MRPNLLQHFIDPLNLPRDRPKPIAVIDREKTQQSQQNDCAEYSPDQGQGGLCLYRLARSPTSRSRKQGDRTARASTQSRYHRQNGYTRLHDGTATTNLLGDRRCRGHLGYCRPNVTLTVNETVFSVVVSRNMRKKHQPDQIQCFRVYPGLQNSNSKFKIFGA